MCEKAKKSKEERGYESLPICHRGPENGIQEADGESGIPSFREMNGSGNSNVYPAMRDANVLECAVHQVNSIIISIRGVQYICTS